MEHPPDPDVELFHGWQEGKKLMGEEKYSWQAIARGESQEQYQKRMRKAVNLVSENEDPDNDEKYDEARKPTSTTEEPSKASNDESEPDRKDRK